MFQDALALFDEAELLLLVVATPVLAFFDINMNAVLLNFPLTFLVFLLANDA